MMSSLSSLVFVGGSVLQLFVLFQVGLFSVHFDWFGGFGSLFVFVKLSLSNKWGVTEKAQG